MKWKDLSHAGVEGCKGGGVKCNQSCTYDVYIYCYRVDHQSQKSFLFLFKKKTLKKKTNKTND